MQAHRPMYRTPAPGGRRNGNTRILAAVVILAIALFSYFGSKQFNPVTGEDQYISLTNEQEIALGLQAAPEMIAQFGGLYPNEDVQNYLDILGRKIVENSSARNAGWVFDFHLLNDNQTLNAFALPGGQVFITAAMYEKLSSEGQLAAVLAHEISHVIGRHGAQQLAKSQLTQGLLQAVLVASEDQNTTQVAALVAQLVNLKYGREDELESDSLGVRFMAQAGYDPRAMIEVMQILEGARPGGAPPEFFSTHPNPENRIAEIEAAIYAEFPDGIPDNLIP